MNGWVGRWKWKDARGWYCWIANLQILHILPIFIFLIIFTISNAKVTLNCQLAIQQAGKGERLGEHVGVEDRAGMVEFDSQFTFSFYMCIFIIFTIKL